MILLLLCILFQGPDMMPRFISRFTEDVGTDRIAQKNQQENHLEVYMGG